MNITLLNDALVAALVFVPVVIAGTQAIKVLGVPERFAPLTAVAVGIALALGTKQTVLVGVLAGLSSVGLYSGFRAVLGR